MYTIIDILVTGINRLGRLGLFGIYLLALFLLLVSSGAGPTGWLSLVFLWATTTYWFAILWLAPVFWGLLGAFDETKRYPAEIPVIVVFSILVSIWFQLLVPDADRVSESVHWMYAGVAMGFMLTGASYVVIKPRRLQTFGVVVGIGIIGVLTAALWWAAVDGYTEAAQRSSPVVLEAQTGATYRAGSDDSRPTVVVERDGKQVSAIPLGNEGVPVVFVPRDSFLPKGLKNAAAERVTAVGWDVAKALDPGDNGGINLEAVAGWLPWVVAVILLLFGVWLMTKKNAVLKTAGGLVLVGAIVAGFVALNGVDEKPTAPEDLVAVQTAQAAEIAPMDTMETSVFAPRPPRGTYILVENHFPDKIAPMQMGRGPDCRGEATAPKAPLDLPVSTITEVDENVYHVDWEGTEPRGLDLITPEMRSRFPTGMRVHLRLLNPEGHFDVPFERGEHAHGKIPIAKVRNYTKRSYCANLDLRLFPLRREPPYGAGWREALFYLGPDQSAIGLGPRHDPIALETLGFLAEADEIVFDLHPSALEAWLYLNTWCHRCIGWWHGPSDSGAEFEMRLERIPA